MASKKNIVATPAKDFQTWFELWKAIHGGCWPGPYPELRVSEAVRDVVSGLAALNLAGAFSDAKTRSQMTSLAKESLQKSLGDLAQRVR